MEARHELFQSFLSRLTKLRHLAFLLDTYPGMPDNAPAAGYDPRDFDRVCTLLEHRVKRSGYFDPAKLRGRGSGQPPARALDTGRQIARVPTRDDHKHRMGRVAHKYAAILPNLEWVFRGQWSMGIGRMQFPTRRPSASPYYVEAAAMDCWKLGQRRPGR